MVNSEFSQDLPGGVGQGWTLTLPDKLLNELYREAAAAGVPWQAYAISVLENRHRRHDEPRTGPDGLVLK